MKLASVLLLALVAALPAFAQQSPREDFREYCRANTGRWVGDVALVMDVPGFGKRGEKMTAYGEITLTEDGHVLRGQFVGGPGTWTWMAVYDPAAKQIRLSGADSGGNVWTSRVAKQGGAWSVIESGTLADGAKYEGRYTLTFSADGTRRTWSGSTIIPGRKADEQTDVWRRVNK